MRFKIYMLLFVLYFLCWLVATNDGEPPSLCVCVCVCVCVTIYNLNDVVVIVIIIVIVIVVRGGRSIN